MNFEKSVTVSAPVNIALIKYWGKENEKKIIPKNNSISLTLDKNQLRSTTSLRISTNLEENSIILNNKKSTVTNRILTMFEYALDKSGLSPNIRDKLKFQIESYNTFPTAAGMASSASGMAALAFALGQVLNLSMDDVSIVARLGSGSATRSVYGGIVEWIKDSMDDSRAVQLYPEDYWPELRVLICVVSGAEKKVPSTVGMQDSLKTSQLMQYRISHSVEENLNELRRALANRDFAKLAGVTMRDSNQFHAICLDTVPPIVYLNESSFAIIDFVNIINEICGSLRLAYTFDAGPNAFLIFEKRSESFVRRLLDFAFLTNLGTEGSDDDDTGLSDEQLQKLMSRLPRYPEGSVKYVISTKIGSGPDK